MGLLKGLLGNVIKNEVSSGISRGISKGISNGISNAIGGAVQKAVTPTAEKWANKTAEGLDKAAGNVEANVKETNSAFDNLRKATENYAAALEKAAKDSGYVADSVKVTNDMLVDDGVPAATKIRKVLASSFSQYEVKENISPSTIGGTGKFMNYSFGVYSAGNPKLFIMLVGKTTCSTRLYRWSKEQAEKQGVKMINFVSHYPNNEKYIEERLKQYL